MTLRGIFVSLLELFLVVLALGTEIREFFVVALCVGGLMAYSFLSLALASLTLRVKSKINKKAIMRGEKIEYTLTLYGIALLPVASYLSIKTTDSAFKFKNRARHAFMMVPSFSIKHDFTFHLPCTHIGLWQIGIKKMRFEDVFGLFSIPLIMAKKEDFEVDLAVMPKIHELAENTESLTSGGYGSTSIKNAEEGDLLGDSRIYLEGDSLKRINWKLSARTKTLYSRQYEMPQKPKIVIMVDTGISGEAMGDMIDITSEIAISLAKYFVTHNNIVDIFTVHGSDGNEDENYRLGGYSDIHKMQYNFAYMEFYKRQKELVLTQFDDWKFSDADKIYLITTNPSDELLSKFTDLNKIGKVVKCFVPKAVFLSDIYAEKTERTDSVKFDITSADLISEMVGEAL